MSDDDALISGLKDLGMDDRNIARHLAETGASSRHVYNDAAGDQGGHRSLLTSPVGAFGLVTRSISKSDATYTSPDMLKAVTTEVNKLIANGTWDLVPVARKLVL